MEGITIRKAGIADLKEIQRLNGELCAKENREFDPAINPDYPFTKEGEEYFTYRMTKDDSLTLIAEDNTGGSVRAVGYLAGGFVKAEDYRIVSRLAESENTYVEEAFRGRGIGTQLASEFEAWCREKGAQRIRHIASVGNKKAIDFYKRSGAEEVSLTLEKEL